MKITHIYILESRFRLTLLLMAIVWVVGFTACARKNPYIIELMPAPKVYTDESIDPFAETVWNVKVPYHGILYASDRKPALEPEKPFYLNERGFLLRLGVAKVKMGEGQFSLEEARRISLLKNRSDHYPLKVTAVEEAGILDRSFSIFTPPELIPANPKAAAERFAELINAKLAISKKKDVYVYVHGYKVVFSNPVLVATELWHYLAYDGVFIAFAWPSTPERLAYTADLETAEFSACNLRKLLEFLAEDTQAEQIHVLGYSAGTRVVLNTLSQLSFIHKNHSKAEIRKRCRIGRIILVGSDYDRQLFGALLAEGMLKIPETLAIYMSRNDKALDFSRWLFRRDRLGQIDRLSLNPVAVQYVNDTPQLTLIDVSDAEGSTQGNGHAYFRKSPWASSDILMSLMYDLEPERPIWTFPNDYIERLKTSLMVTNPNLFRKNP